MSQLPAVGTAPKELLEDWLPRAFAQADLPPETREVEALLGVRLEGEGGGQWLLRLKGGELQVEPGATEPAAFTLIQSVEDWRDCLWGGRGGLFGRQTALFFQPSEAARAVAPPGSPARPLSPRLIAQLQVLQGTLRMVVAGDGEDWTVDFKLGAGPLRPTPTTTVTLSAEDADAMQRGELDALQAFLSGRLRVEGEMAFLMQMQAIQMQAPEGGAG